jgi:hypothetical protein
MTKISIEKILERDFGNNILSLRDLLKLIIKRKKNKNKIRESIFIEDLTKN